MNTKYFYSNCLFEAIKAKIKNHKVRILYVPAFLNEVPCPHLMWKDKAGEHDFHYSGYLPWYKWCWHKGSIQTVPNGYYQNLMSSMIERKYYKYRKDT